MRILLLFMLSSFACLSWGQNLNPIYKQDLNYDDDGKVTFVKVFQADSTSAKDLYTKAEEWFSDTYNSANDVLQVRDKEAGRLIGKGFYNYVITDMVKFEYSLEHTIKIEAREGRYRVTISDLYINGTFNGQDYKEPVEKSIKDESVYKKNGKPRKMAATHKIKILLWAEKKMKDIEKAMKKTGGDDDW